MKKSDFFAELREALELDVKDVTEKTPIHLTSIQTLAIIAFADSNFDKRIKIPELKDINYISDLMNLIGRENLTD
jgi:hypothetical protein